MLLWVRLGWVTFY